MFDRLPQESVLLEKEEGKKKRRLSSSRFVAEKARKSNGGVLRYPFPEFQKLLGKKVFGES
jgi:hypothetical protein